MNYRFNYSFFREWLDANNMQRSEVLSELKLLDYKLINRWYSGESIISIEYLIRLCNTYSIPLGKFFIDLDEEQHLTVRKATDEERELMQERDKTYNGHGRRGASPNPVQRKPTFIPEPENLDTSSHMTASQPSATQASQPVTGSVPEAALSNGLLSVKLQHIEEISKLKDYYLRREEELRKEYQGQMSEQINNISRLLDLFTEQMGSNKKRYPPADRDSEDYIAAEQHKKR